MRVLHLASFDRWSGAVDPAFHDAAALRSAGVESFFAYVGGYKLERKLRDVQWALPILERGHGALATWRSVRAIRRVIREHQIGILHAHLSWDHQLSWFATTGPTRLIRTYHAARSIRRHLLGRTDAIAVINDSLRRHPLFEGRDVCWTPATIDRERFTPEGSRIAFPRPTFGAIGKLEANRGFEDVLHAAALVDRAQLVLVGHGPHQNRLAALARELEIEDRVTFAGYHEDDLPDHYRSFDVLLFAGEGSDEGHRAVAEAMACGVPAAAYPLKGIDAVIGPELAGRFVCDSATPAALAHRAATLAEQRPALEGACVTSTERFGFGPAAERLLKLYAGVRR